MNWYFTVDLQVDKKNSSKTLVDLKIFDLNMSFVLAFSTLRECTIEN